MVSAYYVCDGKADCPENEDEKYCDGWNDLIYPSLFCEIISLAKLMTSFGYFCFLNRSSSSRYPLAIPCKEPLINMTTLTFDFIGSESYVFAGEQDKLCIFEPNECGVLHDDPNGKGLISCEEHVCPRKYFKCPGFYCIPWRLVCNGLWECPGGIDEESCERISCPGMFNCRQSIH